MPRALPLPRGRAGAVGTVELVQACPRRWRGTAPCAESRERADRSSGTSRSGRGAGLRVNERGRSGRSGGGEAGRGANGRRWRARRTPVPPTRSCAVARRAPRCSGGRTRSRRAAPLAPRTGHRRCPAVRTRRPRAGLASGGPARSNCNDTRPDNRSSRLRRESAGGTGASEARCWRVPRTAGRSGRTVAWGQLKQPPQARARYPFGPTRPAGKGRLGPGGFVASRRAQAGVSVPVAFSALYGSATKDGPRGGSAQSPGTPLASPAGALRGTAMRVTGNPFSNAARFSR